MRPASWFIINRHLRTWCTVTVPPEELVVEALSSQFDLLTADQRHFIVVAKANCTDLVAVKTDGPLQFEIIRWEELTG